MKWAIVTGASAGIGEATCQKLAANKYSIFLLARRKERLEKLAQKLRSEFPDQVFHEVQIDLTKTEEIKKFVLKFEKNWNQLEVLVNNAGLALGTSKVQDLDLSEAHQMLNTNVQSLIDLTSQILPYMIRSKNGFIVNLGSVAGRWVYPGGAVYCASKFAVRGFTEGLRQDVHGTGIRVSNIEPGMVESEFSVVRLGDEQKAKSVYAGMKPLTPTDIAETILWVVNQPKHVNIQEVVVFPTDQSAIGMVERRTQK